MSREHPANCGQGDRWNGSNGPAEAGPHGFPSFAPRSDAVPIGDEFFPRPGPHASAWRVVGFAAAFLALITVASLATRGRGSDAAGLLPYDVRGTWQGSATCEIATGGGAPYAAEYTARLRIDGDYRVAEMEWTQGSFLLERSSVRWTAPAGLEYVACYRRSLAEPFLEPPRGAYNRVTLDDGLLSVEAVHPGSPSLPRLRFALPLSRSQRGDPWPDGSLYPGKERGTVEAVVAGRLLKLGRLEFAPGETELELPRGAAALAFRQGAQGERPWPAGEPPQPARPCDGLRLERLAVHDLPALSVSVGPLRACVETRAEPGGRRIPLGDGNGDGRYEDWVELLPDARVTVEVQSPEIWSACVVFHPDGRGVVRIPERGLEIPIERMEPGPAEEMGAAALF